VTVLNFGLAPGQEVRVVYNYDVTQGDIDQAMEASKNTLSNETRIN